MILAHVDIKVDIFQLHPESEEPFQAAYGAQCADTDTSANDEESRTLQAKITRLPNSSLQGVWESYVPQAPSLSSDP